MDLEALDIIKKIGKNDFDVKTFTNLTLHTGSITKELEKLTEAISSIDLQLHTQVLDHQDDLLQESGSIDVMENTIEILQGRIGSLSDNIQLLKQRVLVPYNRLTERVRQLKNLQEACDLLRRIMRITQLSKRLQAHCKAGVTEITKAAQCLSELKYLAEGADMSGIDCITEDLQTITKLETTLIKDADELLIQGLEAQNQSQLATGLQVFFSLGKIQDCVARTERKCLARLSAQIEASLDHATLSQDATRGKNTIKAPGRAVIPVGNPAQFRSNLWSGMEKVLDTFCDCCLQVELLHKILTKKRDPSSQKFFQEQLTDDSLKNLCLFFWNNGTEMLASKLQTSSDKSNYLKQILESEYPKLLRLFNEFLQRLPSFETYARSRHGHLEKPLPLNEFHAPLQQSIQRFETAFISKSLSRLFDPINLIFSSGGQFSSLPTKQEIDSVIKAITADLSIGSFDERLATSIAHNVVKTIQLFAMKFEGLVSTDDAASQVIAPMSESQERNVQIVNSVLLFHSQMEEVVRQLVDYPVGAVGDISSALQRLRVPFCKQVLAPLLDAISDAIEAILMTMHEEDFSKSKQLAKPDCSLYMRELYGFIQRTYSDYMAPIEDEAFRYDCLTPVAKKTVELFLEHSSLLRLGEGGKYQLSTDFVQIESAVEPFCKSVSNLGQTYRMLRTFKPLLFQNTDHIASSSVFATLPYSLVLHHLFSRAPPELKFPHEATGWSVERYLNWLLNRPEKERLLMIKNTLESYTVSVRNSGGVTYVQLYPVMIELLQKGLQQCD